MSEIIGDKEDICFYRKNIDQNEEFDVIFDAVRDNNGEGIDAEKFLEIIEGMT